MPKRMIDGAITTSDSLSRVSIEAAHTFTLLWTLCDDLGRYDGRPGVLRAHLYPLRHDVSEETLSRWINELEAQGCVHRYEVGGRHFLHCPQWGEYQRLREVRSKWPDPAGHCCACQHTAAGCGDSPRLSESPGGPRPEARSEKREAEEPKEPEQTPKRPSPSAPAPWALHCSKVLGELLSDVPGARLPRGWQKRWGAEIARMPGETPELAKIQQQEGEEVLQERLEAAIRWALGPENLGCEFEVEIRSGKSLREKWPQLCNRARRVRAKTAPQEKFDNFARKLAVGET